MKKLLVFDANSILNRAFYGVKPLTTKSGLHTNAIYGYINIITKHIDAINPDCIAAAFDLKAPTFRHKIYSEYKAGRHQMPAELSEQLPYIKDVTTAMGIKILSSEGYEADDILGTLSKEFSDIGHTYIVTGDRDSLQLVGKSTTVILATTGKDEEYTPEKIREKYLVEPKQLIDVKALMGDASDNIKGVSGIGEKTAIKLIYENDNLNTLYSRIDTETFCGTQSVISKLKNDRESAFLSRTLAEICTAVPLNENEDTLKRQPLNTKELSEIFKRLEFTKLLEKFGLNKPSAEDDTLQMTFETAEINPSAPTLVTCDEFVVGDMIFADFDPVTKTFYKEENGKILKTLSSKELIEKMGKKRICLWDSKTFWHEVIDKCAEVNEDAVFFDVKIAAYVENPDTKGDFGRILMRTLFESSTSVLSNQASYRCLFIRRLYEKLSEEISNINSEELYYSIELPTTRILAKMESVGFSLDKENLSKYGESLLEKMKICEEEIYMLCGETFNIISPKQLGHILFEKLNLPIIKKKKTGFSTDAETLEKLRFHSPVIDYILNYRRLSKLYGTYVEGLLKVADNDGRVRTEFKQTGTVTGRLSSTEPNLQNIPVRTEEGSILRKFFIPAPGNVLIDADYSQIELRILAHMAQDDVMIDAFNTGKDIHTMTASKVFKIPYENVTSSLRNQAKAVNFGIVYGIGDFSLSEDLKISMYEAKNYIRGYFETYKKVKEYLDKTVENAISEGFVETLFSRRRYIPELSSSNKNLQAFGKRVAMNTPIQGTAADIIKKAMIAIDRRLEREKLKARLILQVHDELILESPEEESLYAAQILKEEMENAANLSLKLRADVGIGNNWLGAKK